MSADENLKNLNIKLPKANDPVGSYAATRISGNLLYISGQISIDENGKLIKIKYCVNFNCNTQRKAVSTDSSSCM